MKKLLLVVDFQNDFVSGSLGFESASKLEDKIVNKILSYREDGNDVAFTFDTGRNKASGRALHKRNNRLAALWEGFFHDKRRG